jgi:hypothetical protein
MLSYDPPPHCPICKKPIDLTRDRFADEDGHVVHETCYLSRLGLGQNRNNPSDPHHTE